MQDARQTLDKMVSSALIQIIHQRPFFYSLLKRIPKVFRTELARPCAIGIDENTGRLSILLNLNTLPLTSYHEVQICLEHLLLHILLPQHHQDRIQHGHEFHLACDIIINQSIEYIKGNPKYFAKGNSPFGKLLTPVDLKGLHSFHEDTIDQCSVYEIWPIITNEKHLSDPDSYDTIDETDFCIQNIMSINRWRAKDSSNSHALHLQVNHAIVTAVSEMQRSGQNIGNLPGELYKRIHLALEQSGVDYSALIMKFATQAIGRTQIRRTWARVHRKYPNEIRGRFPKITKKPRLLVVMDTSGSMWHDSLLAKVLAELKKIHQVCPDLWVVGGDVKEQFRLHLTTGELYPGDICLHGGGGTDLQFGWDVGKELDVEGIIVLTDGQIPDFKTHELTTIFVIVPGGNVVPDYENIFLI